MTVNRREFLGGIFAALLLPKVAAAKSQRFYDWSKWTGFKPAQDSTRIVGQFVAHRNDGEFFYCHVPLDLEEIALLEHESVHCINVAARRIIDGKKPVGQFQELLFTKTESGRLLMESFLDSRCACSVRYPVRYETLIDEGGEYQMPVYARCDVHHPEGYAI